MDVEIQCERFLTIPELWPLFGSLKTEVVQSEWLGPFFFRHLVVSFYILKGLHVIILNTISRLLLTTASSKGSGRAQEIIKEFRSLSLTWLGLTIILCLKLFVLFSILHIHYFSCQCLLQSELSCTILPASAWYYLVLSGDGSPPRTGSSFCLLFWILLALWSLCLCVYCCFFIDLFYKSLNRHEAQLSWE